MPAVLHNFPIYEASASWTGWRQCQLLFFCRHVGGSALQGAALRQRPRSYTTTEMIIGSGIVYRGC
eukprot:5664196-Pyramimonas_sp.AAC.1